MESPFLEVSHPAYNDLLRTGWTSVGRTRVGLWFAVEKPDDDHSKDDLEDMWKKVEKPGDIFETFCFADEWTFVPDHFAYSVEHIPSKDEALKYMTEARH